MRSIPPTIEQKFSILCLILLPLPLLVCLSIDSTRFSIRLFTSLRFELLPFCQIEQLDSAGERGTSETAQTEKRNSKHEKKCKQTETKQKQIHCVALVLLNCEMIETQSHFFSFNLCSRPRPFERSAALRVCGFVCGFSSAARTHLGNATRRSARSFVKRSVIDPNCFKDISHSSAGIVWAPFLRTRRFAIKSINIQHRPITIGGPRVLTCATNASRATLPIDYLLAYRRTYRIWTSTLRPLRRRRRDGRISSATRRSPRRCRPAAADFPAQSKKRR